ncbi:SDR family NAD(P)-dependent oxidoreductase [Emcibacter nanhaiensis]|uniref:SDR family oxidoreductase n=1 Tax=Emcibacter nanhaiensis TaxID=1505037 RepID=A0A501PUN0_9PROT|nr:SDR family NAD(P)-dependent oxidoreductase [Emcibacter nanhaiensis]TPD63797.1 SDR family oxidoreductase [Emcibacter nanhaiensis]
MSEKVALVTGAAAGIGAEICRRLASEGYAVGVLDINIDDASRVADEIVAAGGKAIALEASVADRPQVIAAADKLRAEYGPITILVNNAGITGWVPFEEITDDDWDRMMAINTRGVFIPTQVILPDMKAAKWGRIVNISSSSAQSGTALMAHYSASKGAVISMTRSLALELGPLGITVNNVPPASIAGTVMFEATKDKMPLTVEQIAQMLPVRRMGEAQDIANAVAWLVKEETGYVTGQTIGVNGGRVVS